GGLRRDERRRCQESRSQRRDERCGARPREVARNGFDDVDAGVKTIALVAAEEERPVFDDRAAHRAAELILFEQRRREVAVNRAVLIANGVKVVARVEGIAPQVLEQRSAEQVCARLRDDADLSAAARAELGGIGARLDAELLDVLETRLQ